MSTLRLFAFVILATLFSTNAHALKSAHSDFSTSPISNGEQKWRLGYYEGGAHGNYYEYLSAVIQGLMELGWIDRVDVPRHQDKDTRAMWSWLSRNVSSDYLEFVNDAYYSAHWDLDIRRRLRKELIDRVGKRRDLDLIFALGTWAGKDLASDEHSIPVIVMSTSDPVGSGIIRSVDDSGRDHVHARVDPFRYERQVRVFHDIIHFGRLGVAYENTPDGRNYAAMEMVEKVARERGFEVLRCHTKSDIADQNLAGESVLDCFKRLAEKADAIYVTLQGGVNAETIPRLVRIANRHRVPTFSQAGSEEVEYGFLLSISRPSFKAVGLFLAATVAKVLNGAKPRELNQLFEESPNIAINLKTAEVIGLYLYADVLAAADEIYREISIPEQAP
jgi:ABC-type uncharacterized transport system substrate-binding protein